MNLFRQYSALLPMIVAFAGTLQSDRVIAAELEIIVGDHTRVVGEYRDGDVSIGFSTARNESIAELQLLNGAGVEILHAQRFGESAFLSLMDGSQVLTVDQSMIDRAIELMGRQHSAEGVPNEAKLAPVMPGGDVSENKEAGAQAKLEKLSQHLTAAWKEVEKSGSDTAFEDLRRTPEYKKLTDLSYALGKAGYTGENYPGTLPLHFVAMYLDGIEERLDRSAAAAADRYADRPPETDVTYRYKLPNVLRNPNLGKLEQSPFYDNSLQCGPPPDMFTSQEVAQAWHDCMNLSCPAYPNRDDDCRGMCGPGCKCWSWVCGDCCYNELCNVHDAVMRSCDGATDVVACVLAYIPPWALVFGCS